jgi:hypothetical protein
MTQKQLQPDSKYNTFDVDGDGIVSDDERVAMLSSILTVAALLTPLIGIERMNTASGFLNTFLVAQTGIVVGFMGMTAWAKSKD